MSEIFENATSAPNTRPAPDIMRIILLVLSIGLLIFASFYILKPFLPALIWSAMIVIASWRLMLSLQNKLRGSRALAVIVMTSALIVVLLLPLTIALSTIVSNVGEVGSQLQKFASEGVPPPPEWLKNLPLVGQKLVDRWHQAANLEREDVVRRLSPYVGEVVTWVVTQIGGFGQVIVHFILTVILATVLYLRGERAAEGITKFARRLAHERGENAVTLAAQAIRAVANGVIITAIIQTCMTGIGLLIAGVPYLVILCSITFLLCIVQLGAAPVLIGSIAWLFYNDASFAAWVFVVWSIIIMITDNFVRPILIKRGADLPLLLIFAGVIGGLLSFGIIGIFIGPVILAISYTLMIAWINDIAIQADSAA